MSGFVKRKLKQISWLYRKGKINKPVGNASHNPNRIFDSNEYETNVSQRF